jgi:O-antigen ligase
MVSNKAKLTSIESREAANLAQIHSRKILNILFLYFLSLNILTVFGLQETMPNGIIQIWNILWFLILAGTMLYVSKFRYISTKYLPLIALFLISTFLTIWNSVVGTGNLSVLANSSQILPPIFMILFLVLLGKERLSLLDVRKFNVYIISFAVFCSVYNLISNYAFIANEWLNVADPYESVLSSFYLNRNTFGFLLSFAIAAVILNLITESPKKNRLLYISTLLLLMTNLILTLSRGAILMTIIFFIIFTILRKGVAGIFKAVVVLAILAFAVFSLLGSDFVNVNLIRKETGTTGRDALQSYGVEYFQANNLLTGSGVGIAGSALFSDYGYSSFHSAYVTVLVDGGILYMITYIFILLVAFSNMKKIHRKNTEYGSFFMALFIAYVAYGFFEANILFRFDPNSILATFYLFLLPLYLANYLTETKKFDE